MSNLNLQKTENMLYQGFYTKCLHVKIVA